MGLWEDFFRRMNNAQDNIFEPVAEFLQDAKTLLQQAKRPDVKGEQQLWEDGSAAAGPDRERLMFRATFVQACWSEAAILDRALTNRTRISELEHE